MAEFPDPNSGGLNPQAGSLNPLGTPKPKAPLGKRVRAWALLLLICAIPVGLAIGGGFLVRSALRPGRAWDDRLFNLAVSFTLFAPLAIVVWGYLRRKWTLGRWNMTKEESRQKLTQCSTRSCGARQNSWVIFAIKWASYAAMDPSCPPWQRAAGWAVLAIYAISLLALTAFGVICIGAAFADNNTVTATCLFIGLGLVILIFPAVAVRSLIRGIRAGKVGATREDLDQMRAQQSARHAREWQKPLRSKLLSTVLVLAFYSLWWLRVTVHHKQHPHESWVTPAMWTPVLIYGIYSQFRKPKSATPATEN